MDQFEDEAIARYIGASYEEYAVTALEGEINMVEILSYPNPVHSHLYINEINIEKIALYDLTGKPMTIRWVRSSEGGIEVDMDQLNGGTYLLIINDTQKQIIIKE